MQVRAKSVVKYAVLPGVVPICRELGMTGFSHVAFFMAQILRSVNLLPAGHPYLSSLNMGRFGIRHVLAESGRSLVFDRKHIDQIIIYGAMLVGLVVLAMQLFMLLASGLIAPAMAIPANYEDFFITPLPFNDIAFIMLDRVFGVPGMFDSCVALAAPCMDNTVADGPFPSAFHYGLHAMFRFYSLALLVIALLIFSYFIATTVAETAQDGTPFGRRFNGVWAPIRMVVALGLLFPIGGPLLGAGAGPTGMNSAQFIVLYAAKWGSGFATNAWILFNDVLTGTYLGDQALLIASPKIPELDRMIQFMLMAQTCRHAVEMKYPEQTPILPYVVRDPVAAPNAIPFLTSTWDVALAFSYYQNVIVHIGHQDFTAYPLHKGHVGPICGSFTIPVTDLEEPGAQFMLEFYYEFLQYLYLDMVADGEVIAMRNLPPDMPALEAPIETDRLARLFVYNVLMRAALAESVAIQAAAAEFERLTIMQYGWAGAAIWYNKLAQMNGAVTTSVFNIPRPKLYPEVMEHVLDEKQQHNVGFTTNDMFNRQLGGEDTVEFSEADAYIYDAIYDAYRVIEAEDSGRLHEEHRSMTGNVVIDFINVIFGTSGLMNIRENADIHPLAQLSAVGKSLIESTIRNVAWALGAGSMAAFFGSDTLELASGLLVTFAMVGLTAGFALFYVVPFLPFLYFFFSAVGWIKGIFEAMVGVPLWALAHIRIDGQGLPGDAAANGYYLIFEVFLRPILMLFGLLGSILIFAAAVWVLNDIWDLVIHNLTGFDIEEQADPDLADIEFYRGPIDAFFFMVIYTIIVYMIGVSCFKMVYLVPNNILRWMGAGVSTFGDQSNDPTQGLMQTVAIGGGSVSSQLGGALKQGVGAGRALGNAARSE